MEQSVEQLTFSKADYQHFQQQLFDQLDLLKILISTPNFGKETLKIGAELEYYLINNKGEAVNYNQRMIATLADNQYQPELNQYNLELNLSAINQEKQPFNQLNAELTAKHQILTLVAKQHKCHALPIGILPTLKKEQLIKECITPLNRYLCLADHIYQQRGKAFNIHIEGSESLHVDFKDICAEGANTSFQVHLMTKPEKLVDVYNAAQLTLPLVTAIAANSPVFLHKDLWHESRIALFKQSLDVRLQQRVKWQQPTRVNFGFGWLRENIWELFTQAVALYPPLIPYNKPENNSDPFHELNFHLGTIWPWIRPVLSTSGNGHIRLEFRAIPAGPSVPDMLTNAAFAIGLAIGLTQDSDKQINQLISSMPFRFAEYNFYRAAKHGLNARILWPMKNKYQPTEVDIAQVIEQLLPIAHQGLTSLNVSEGESTYYLGLIEARLTTNITGAIWQKNTLSHLSKTLPREDACQQLVQRYLDQYNQGKTITEWDRIWI